MHTTLHAQKTILGYISVYIYFYVFYIFYILYFQFIYIFQFIVHVYDFSIKLNRATALLFKMRKYVSLKILRSIYFTIFDSYLSYCCLVWAQNFSTIQQILILQKKAVRIIDFQPRNFHTSPLFKQNSILKFKIIHHHQFLIHGLVFPQTNITMKPQVLQRIIS